MKIIKASIRAIVVITIISFSFIGSDCNEILENITNTCTGNQVDLIGSWKFTQHLGGIRDICVGEVVQFTSGGTATLTCPNQTPLNRTYSVSNNVLTYSETNVQYCITGDADELTLTGMNNDRILYYVKTIIDDNQKKKETVSGNIILKNSSELTK